jgi:hypothetical protein
MQANGLKVLIFMRTGWVVLFADWYHVTTPNARLTWSRRLFFKAAIPGRRAALW